MTILFLSRLFYPHIGGVETHVLEIGKRLIKRGHRVIVITEEYQSKDSSAKTTGEVEGIEIRRIDVGQDNSRKKFRIWRQLFKLKQIIKDADIVHCHDVFFWYLPFRFLYPKKKVFTTFHGYETKFPPSKKAILIRRISEKLSWGNICVGDYIKKWYGTTPTFVTYGGVEIRNPKFEIRNKFKTQISKPKIVFIGRLEEDTGILIYLKVIDVLKKRKISFEFEACGDGTLRRIAMKYGKAYGFVKDIGKYIDRSDFVFTSSYLSILKAISRGKIVFSVFQNKLKEDYLKMAPFAKWIVIGNSPEGLVDKILYLLKHQEKKEIITNTAYNWVKTQTWEKVLGIYIELWGLKIPDRQWETDMGSVQIRRCGETI